jgi:hypothetical protein
MTKRNDLATGRGALVAMTALAAGHAGAADLRNFVVDLYGGDGIQLSAVTPVPNADRHVPHFTDESLEAFDALNSAVVSGIGTFAFNSTFTGISFDVATGVPVTTQDSLGPLLAERATTLGKGKVDLGFGISSVKYDRIDGVELDNVLLDFPHEDCCSPNPAQGGALTPPADGQLTGFENDIVSVRINAELKYDVFAFFANYGLTEQWDIGIVVPVVSVEARASAHAEVRALSGSNIHSFFGQGELQDSRTGDKKTGIGDVIVRTKYNFLRDDTGPLDLAVLAQVTAATGDEENLLGTGETRYKAGLIASKHLGVFGPHVNVAYETSSGPDYLDNFTYAVGVDARLSQRVTLGGDVLGRYNPDQEQIGDHVVDFALSGKWNPFSAANAPFNAYVIVPLNRDEGLRADVVYGIGVDVIF